MGWIGSKVRGSGFSTSVSPKNGRPNRNSNSEKATVDILRFAFGWVSDKGSRFIGYKELKAACQSVIIAPSRLLVFERSMIIFCGRTN
jgi:hypothetical protein